MRHQKDKNMTTTVCLHSNCHNVSCITRLVSCCQYVYHIVMHSMVCDLYHSVWAFERYRHSVQTPCTLSAAFEARVYESSMATVASFSKL